MLNDNETVAEFFASTGMDRTSLDNFAFYMLGLDRRIFHQCCNVQRDQDPQIFARCWQAFNQWQEWLEDVSRQHNS